MQLTGYRSSPPPPCVDEKLRNPARTSINDAQAMVTDLIPLFHARLHAALEAALVPESRLEPTLYAILLACVNRMLTELIRQLTVTHRAVKAMVLLRPVMPKRLSAVATGTWAS